MFSGPCSLCCLTRKLSIQSKMLNDIAWYRHLVYNIDITCLIHLSYIILYYIILYYIILNYIILYYIKLNYIIFYYIMLYYIKLYEIILYYIILYHIISYYIISYHIILYYIILQWFNISHILVVHTLWGWGDSSTKKEPLSRPRKKDIEHHQTGWLAVGTWAWTEARSGTLVCCNKPVSDTFSWAQCTREIHYEIDRNW